MPMYKFRPDYVTWSGIDDVPCGYMDDIIDSAHYDNNTDNNRQGLYNRSKNCFCLSYKTIARMLWSLCIVASGYVCTLCVMTIMNKDFSKYSRNMVYIYGVSCAVIFVFSTYKCIRLCCWISCTNSPHHIQYNKCKDTNIVDTSI